MLSRKIRLSDTSLLAVAVVRLAVFMPLVLLCNIPFSVLPKVFGDAGYVATLPSLLRSG